MSWRIWVPVLLILILLWAIIWPAIIPRTRTVHLDINNGRHHVVEKLFGVTLRDEIVNTDFTKLVEQYRLEDEPEWVFASHNGLSLTGDFRSCSLKRHGHLPGNYQMFAGTVYPHSSIDDPTTFILEMRRLAKVDHGRGVGDLLSSITEQADWPVIKAKPQRTQ